MTIIMKKAVIFDLDGTLLNTLEDIADSMNFVLKSFSFPQHDLLSYKTFIGNGVSTLVKRSLPPHEQTPLRIKECLLKMEKRYSVHYKDKTLPFLGITKLLTELQQLEIPLSVLSNKDDSFTKQMVLDFFPTIKFLSVQGAEKSIPHKPDPQMALLIAKKSSTKVEDVFFVGDSSVDMETAKNAGMFPIGVTWGFRTEAELLSHGAKYIAHGPEEILSLIVSSL